MDKQLDTVINNQPTAMKEEELIGDDLPVDSHKSLLDHLIEYAPYFFDLYGPNVSRAITDKEKFIFVIPSQVSQLGVKPGDPVKPGSSTHKAMETGERMVTLVPANLYGQPYIATAIPINNNSGQVIGSMVTISLAVKQEKFARMSSELNQSIEGISDNTSNLVASSQQLVAEAAQLVQNSQLIGQETRHMDDILALVEEITQQTHLLGLNAAIEAARAGDMGRGFNVVAEEIRKLALRTAGSVKDINEKLKSIQDKITQMEQHSGEILAVSETQVSSIEEIDQSIRDISETANELNAEASNFEIE
ncbi:Methyl-accepting chemotaxis protein (MCP) signalling domain-containing protein [Desulfotomaculum arcticum]|uniref:Methyl-accepting chemotaxis protein (MCP) signalling domain-containing protein n=1 Tax=Desulfotruncus arcticus DSM 17038 TaxID=1121424 RepID=A0A1I2WGT0_9FIRM|nr:methyl-accepting chemotaxis protein [Desulfotruncus arcticus]SFH00550.1 Methyl-accepting chemotaxis protein (MCP) signalling domain-containing protein [Desulfotomaculum arcticum] [Desulfotruncus arcticus DSM 17038]